MTQTVTNPPATLRAFRQVHLRPLFRRLKKIMGFGRVSAIAARVDRLSELEPRIEQIEQLQSRVEHLERRIEELEALFREQAGLRYLQLAAGVVEAPADAPFSQRRAK